jgi:hypothetical protein
MIALLSINHTTFDDVYHRQEMVVMAAVADDKLEGLRSPTRAYSNETQQQRDSGHHLACTSICPPASARAGNEPAEAFLW